MDFDYYSGRDLTYPVRPKRPTLAPKHTSQDARDYADAMEHYESALADYTVRVGDYSMKSRARLVELTDTLRSVYDLNEKQFNLLWDRAWDDGHSSGLQRVVDVFRDYYDLVDQFIKLEG